MKELSQPQTDSVAAGQGTGKRVRNSPLVPTQIIEEWREQSADLFQHPNDKPISDSAFSEHAAPTSAINACEDSI